MSARAIVAGAIFKEPQTKIIKTGKPYAVATIRECSGERVRWWKAFFFNESAIEELGDGGSIAVAGEFDCEPYTPPGGELRLSWKIIADAVLSARAKPKKSKPQDGRQPFETKRWGGPDDAVPF
jgi:hypothetical protein